MLNIDVAATAFLEPLPVLRFLCDVLRKPETAITLDDRTELRKAQKAIVGLKASLLPPWQLFSKRCTCPFTRTRQFRRQHVEREMLFPSVRNEFLNFKRF